uniref:SIR2-like domain-containing protein n=1 Tax=Prevotella sp. GTC17262 TaxID=3236797 RepID=A0AB33JFQ9_9BACT
MSKFKDIDMVEAIKAMRQHIIDGRMSLLVGAGASCCACKLYQDWFGLIKDMVAFLYADELKAKGVKVTKDERFYCHYTIEKARKNSKVAVDDVIWNIIEREGVLQIPSLFKQRTGLRESVEVYIEAHTPKLNMDDNTATLFDESVFLGHSTDFLASMLSLGWNAIFTTNYDNLLEYVAMMNGMRKFKESNCAADLSFRNMREMIVKLHGSIDFKHESNGFDSDKHRKYIITQEDYDDYPAKHEAFVQLMRISLLKDCLCLVGFSGKDANFIAWINWVREIIEMSAQHNTPDYPQAKNIKVFFIDARGDKQDDATQLYFENHRIYRISLKEKRVVELIGAEIPDENDPECGNKLFKAFFNYLNAGEANNHFLQEANVDETIKGQDNVQQRHIAESEEEKGEEDKGKEQNILQDTFSLWAKAYKFTSNHGLEVDIDEGAAHRLIRYNSYLRLARGTHYQSSFIDVISKKQELSELEAEMALMALEQMQGDYENEALRIIEKIENVLQGDTYQERVNRLKNRHFTLVSPLTLSEGKSDMAMYESCVRLAFTFEFSKLNDMLNDWQPAEDFIIKKLVLLSFVNIEAVNGILSQSLLDKIHPSIERFRATQLANMLFGRVPGVYSVEEFTDLSQYSIFSLRDWYFDHLIQPKERIRAYGIEMDSDREIRVEDAVRCLNFMLETPLMPQIRTWSIVSSAQWYKVAHVLFEKYPYPVLFYSSTINDSDTLKRIGQDFAYSDVLHNELPKFAVRMFKLITNEEQPKSDWTVCNICLLLCEIIKAIPPSYWDAFILRLWKEYFLPQFDETHKSGAIYKLICAGLSCTKNEELAIVVINDCLEVVRENGKYHIVQDLFYYLRTRCSRKVSIAIKPALKVFISKIDNGNDFILLGNLHHVIGKSQYKAVAKKIPVLISSLGIKTSTINGLVYYAKSDKKVLRIVKKALLDSDLLWGNGIKGTGTFTSPDYVAIVDLDDVLEWTVDEVHAVYDKLVASAMPLLKRINGTELDQIMHYENLIYEMMLFIDLHRQELSDKEGLDTLYNALEEKYKLLTDYVDLDKSIYSDIDSEMEACLDALIVKVKKEGIYCHIAYINVLVTRLLCRNRNSYRKVLDHMQYYVRYHLNTPEDLCLIPQLQTLIDKLTLDEFRNLEQNVILCAEISILMVEKLQKLGMKSQGIDYWMKLKNDRYFNWSICEN